MFKMKKQDREWKSSEYSLIIWEIILHYLLSLHMSRTGKDSPGGREIEK